MKKFILFLVVAFVTAAQASARDWRVGPSSVIGMDFADINAAMASSSVVDGDVLYLDQHLNVSTQTVTKAVTIIGTGYDTALSDEGVVAVVADLYLKCDNVKVKSLQCSNVYLFNSECIIDRCYFRFARIYSSAGLNHFYSCYCNGKFYSDNTSYPMQVDVQNCVIQTPSGDENISYATKSVFNNNVFVNASKSSTYYYIFRQVTNSTITNNILFRTGYAAEIFDKTFGNAIEHNIATSSISGFPTNKVLNNPNTSDLFVFSGNYSDYYRLSETSIAKGYATDGGDCGVHGGMFGCPSGGRPQYVPYFEKVVVGQRTENGKLPVSVKVKIQED